MYRFTHHVKINNNMTPKKTELHKDVAEFVDSFMEKVKDKQIKNKFYSNYQVIDAVRDMLIHKLIKEGWAKGTLPQ